MRIEASDIACQAGGRTILGPLDLALDGPGLTGLIGPNGAGKTTLLRVLTGVRRPDRGHVAYDGRPVAALGRSRARMVAFLAQGGEVNWALRVDRLVGLGRLAHHRAAGPRPGDRQAVDRALAAAGVEHLRERTIATLSGGERMRVLLARALAVEAPVLLADEPIAALDPHHQIRVMELLRAQADAGTAIAVVLHDLTLAHRFCDRLVLLEGGRLMADGRPEAVLSDSQAAAAYAIRLLRGPAPGGQFVLPWSQIPPDAIPPDAKPKTERKQEA